MVRSNFKLRSWSSVLGMLKQCSLLIEVVDARNIAGTRIPRLESGFGGKLVLAATKADLLPFFPPNTPAHFGSKKEEGKPSLNAKGDLSPPTYYCSSRTRKGVDKIRALIKKTAAQKIAAKKRLPIRIFIFGIPNVGKSSLINSISGRSSAKAGFRSGITRGLQNIRLDKNIMLVDAPGVVDLATGEEYLALNAAIDAQRLSNPYSVAQKVLAKFIAVDDDSIFSFYKIKKSMDIDEVLNLVAISRGLLLKGGEPNCDEAAKILIRDFQKGKIFAKEK